MFGKPHVVEREAEEQQEDDVFDGRHPFVHFEGEFELRHMQFFRDVVREFLQGTEGAEPAAEEAAIPHQRAEGRRAPKDEDDGIHQEDVPVEAFDERVGEGEDIHHRQLPVH